MGDFRATARWIFPVSGPPVEHGVLSVVAGRVESVRDRNAVTPDIDFGHCAIVPGLVNVHTHLDLSGARGRTPPGPDFTDWLQRVIEFRSTRDAPDIANDIRLGLAESRQYGTTLIGDISAHGESAAICSAAAMRATVFRELIGLALPRSRQAIRDAMPWLTSAATPDLVRVGLSPHAPYSFNVHTLESISHCTVELGTHRTFPLAIHLAESAAERELLEMHTGPFVPFLNRLGAWEPTGLARSPEQIVDLTQMAQSVIYVHCNNLRPVPMTPRASIAYCPRTHAAFGHPPHPFREFLARGVRVALGTDSLASNPDLSVLAEARFLAARHPDLNRPTLLRMATLNGAEALGWAKETGSLDPGKSADFVVIPLPDRDAADPHELLFDSDRAVQSVWFRGEKVEPVA